MGEFGLYGIINGGNKLSSCTEFGELLGGKDIDAMTWRMES